MGRKTLVSGAMAASLLVSGCAGGQSDDTAGLLLIGAAVIGLGVLAATASDDDSDRDDRSSSRRRSHDSNYREEYSYAGNGQCDDPRYRTSNGGRASPGTDERDCRRYGQGRK